jgi:hypothetical protein
MLTIIDNWSIGGIYNSAFAHSNKIKILDYAQGAQKMNRFGVSGGFGA